MFLKASYSRLTPSESLLIGKKLLTRLAQGWRAVMAYKRRTIEARDENTAFVKQLMIDPEIIALSAKHPLAFAHVIQTLTNDGGDGYISAERSLSAEGARCGGGRLHPVDVYDESSDEESNDLEKEGWNIHSLRRFYLQLFDRLIEEPPQFMPPGAC
jgi:hypothetical protein